MTELHFTDVSQYSNNEMPRACFILTHDVLFYIPNMFSCPLFLWHIELVFEEANSFKASGGKTDSLQVEQ